MMEIHLITPNIVLSWLSQVIIVDANDKHGKMTLGQFDMRAD
jgi:hypothetical protein